jgi:hypothetical protein
VASCAPPGYFIYAVIRVTRSRSGLRRYERRLFLAGAIWNKLALLGGVFWALGGFEPSINVGLSIFRS